MQVQANQPEPRADRFMYAYGTRSYGVRVVDYDRDIQVTIEGLTIEAGKAIGSVLNALERAGIPIYQPDQPIFVQGGRDALDVAA